MEKSQLIEKRFQEYEKAEKLLKNRKPENFSIEKLFPELKLPEVNSRKTYGYYIFDKPVYALIPYLDDIIINVPPFKNREALEKKLKISLDYLIELQERNRVSINLDSDPVAYENLDYMDEIIENAPSSQIRNDMYLKFINPENNYSEISNKIFDGKLFDYAKKIKWDAYVNKFENEIENTAKNILTQLGALGYKSLFDKLTGGKYSPEEIYNLIYTYSSFLTDPVFCSLEGITPIDKYSIENPLNSDAYKDISPLLKDKIGQSKKIMEFPTDVGIELLRNNGVYFPSGIDTALQIDTEKARKALFELDRAINERMDREKIVDRKIALEEEFKQINDAVNVYNKSQNNKIKDKVDITIGIIGAASSLFLDKPLLLASLITTALSLESVNIPTKIAERILKFRKPSHIVAYMDFHNEIKNLNVSGKN